MSEFYFMAPSPKPIDPYFNVTKPFDIYGWGLILASLLVSTLLLFWYHGLISAARRKVSGKPAIKDDTATDERCMPKIGLTKSQLGFFAWRTLMKQGEWNTWFHRLSDVPLYFLLDPGFNLIQRFPHSGSLRLLLVVWGVFALVMTAAYSGNLNAYLVAVDYEKTIDNGRDILELNRNLLLPRSNALYNIIATSPYSVYQQLLQVNPPKSHLP